MANQPTQILVPIGITVEDILSQFRAIVREEMKSIQLPEKEERPLSRAEACEFFGVSANTIKKWTDEGLLQPTTIKRRVYFKKSDLVAAGQTLKKYKRSA